MLIGEIAPILERETQSPDDEEEEIFFDDADFRQLQYDNLLELEQNFDHGPGQVQPQTEILAFYKPFHYNNTHGRRWGIYLKRSGIDIVRLNLMAYAAPHGHNFEHNIQTITQIAIKKLLLHEIKHHAIEIAFTRLELLTNHHNLFEQYITDTYLNREGKRYTEAICNHNVFKKPSTFKITSPNPVFDFIQENRPNVIHTLDLSEYVTTFMLNQPPGYCDFRQNTVPNNLHTQLHLLGIQENDENNEQIKRDFKQHANLSKITNFPVPLYLSTE